MTAFERIRDAHVPLFLQRFEAAAKDYNSEGEGFEPHTVLGIRGQFADIWRKVWKLKKALWDGETLAGEQPIEIIDDLLAHLFLTRDLIVETLPQPGTFKDVGVVRQDGEAILGTQKTFGDVVNAVCGEACTPRRHTFTRSCRYRLAKVDES